MFNEFNNLGKPDVETRLVDLAKSNLVAQRRKRPIYDSGTIQDLSQRLLHGPARWALVAVAQFSSVYILHPLGKEPDEFKVWIEALAQARPGHDGFVSLDDWRDGWREYYRALLFPTTR